MARGTKPSEPHEPDEPLAPEHPMAPEYPLTPEQPIAPETPGYAEKLGHVADHREAVLAEIDSLIGRIHSTNPPDLNEVLVLADAIKKAELGGG